MTDKLIDYNEDIIFKPDVIDYSRFVNRLGGKYFPLDKTITHDDLLPVVGVEEGGE